MLASLRDVAAALYAMSALDPDSVGGAIVRQEERRWGGMQHLAGGSTSRASSATT